MRQSIQYIILKRSEIKVREFVTIALLLVVFSNILETNKTEKDVFRFLSRHPALTDNEKNSQICKLFKELLLSLRRQLVLKYEHSI